LVAKTGVWHWRKKEKQLELRKAFDTVSNATLVTKLERFDGWKTQWIRNLSGWSQSKSCSKWLNVQLETSDEWPSSGTGVGTDTV